MDLMSRKSLSILGIALFVGNVYGNDDWSMNNRFTITGEYVYMKRNPLGRSHTIVQEVACPQITVPCICPPCEEPKPVPPIKDVLNTRQVIKETKFQSGYRVGFFLTPSVCRSLEASYMKISDWHAEITRCGDCCNLRFPFCPSTCICNFVDAQQACVQFNSHFKTLEVNYWEHVTPRRCNYFSYSWLLGFRYFDFDEMLNISFTRGASRSSYDIKTDNDLYGGQVGINLQVNPYPLVSWDFTLKGGILGNGVRQKTCLGDFNNRISVRDFDREKTVASYMGDGAVTFTAQIMCHLNLHIGYEGIYIANLALATDQLDKKLDRRILSDDCCCKMSKEKSLNTRGRVFIQGGFVGAGLSF